MIRSYGVVLYCTVDGEKRYLLIKKRDNFWYKDFLSGKWSKRNIRYVISKMCPRERFRLLNFTFDELWDDLWVSCNSVVYRKRYSRAKSKFNSVKNELPKLCEEVKCEYSDTYWEFPKGKKINNENEMMCAIREFREETLLDNIYLYPDGTYIDEEFRGTDGKLYSTRFFFARANAMMYPKKQIYNRCIRKVTLSEEASELEWLSKDDVLSLIGNRRSELFSDRL